MIDLQAIVDEAYVACEGNHERIKAAIKAAIHERCVNDPSFLSLYLEYTWAHGLVDLVSNTEKRAQKLQISAAIARGERPMTGADHQGAPREQWSEIHAKHRAAKVAALRDELGKKGTAGA